MGNSLSENTHYEERRRQEAKHKAEDNTRRRAEYASTLAIVRHPEFQRCQMCRADFWFSSFRADKHTMYNVCETCFESYQKKYIEQFLSTYPGGGSRCIQCGNEPRTTGQLYANRICPTCLLDKTQLLITQTLSNQGETHAAESSDSVESVPHTT